MTIANLQVQRIRLNLDLIVRWIQQNCQGTEALNHYNASSTTKFSLKIVLIIVINGRLTFEPNSGDIADAEMNRIIVEIVGNEIASFTR